MDVGLILLDGWPVGHITVDYGSIEDNHSPDAIADKQAGNFTPVNYTTHEPSLGPSRGAGTQPTSRRGTHDEHFDRGKSYPELNLDDTPVTGERVYGGFAEARDRAKQELKDKPWLNEKAIHIVAGENPQEAQAVWEETINRMAVRGTTLEREFRNTWEGGYYAGNARSVDPSTRRRIEAARDRALNYSNVSNYATGNASVGLAQRKAASGGWVRHRGAGETFFAPNPDEGPQRRRWREMVNESEDQRTRDVPKNITEIAPQAAQLPAAANRAQPQSQYEDFYKYDPDTNEISISKNPYPWMRQQSQDVEDVPEGSEPRPDSLGRAFAMEKWRNERYNKPYTNPLSKALGVGDVSREILKQDEKALHTLSGPNPRPEAEDKAIDEEAKNN